MGMIGNNQDLFRQRAVKIHLNKQLLMREVDNGFIVVMDGNESVFSTKHDAIEHITKTVKDW